MRGSFTIYVEQPSGNNVTQHYFTARAFRRECQRLLGQSHLYSRTVNTSHHASFECVQIAHSAGAQRPAVRGLSLS
jgi:hypothetical protein